MLFTDGGEERAQSILEKYNADKKVPTVMAPTFYFERFFYDPNAC